MPRQLAKQKTFSGMDLVNKAKANKKRASRPATAPHVIVEALAGTGKTFTLVEGCKRIRGKKTKGVKGSPQQEAVWEVMTAGPAPKYITFCAFNKSISLELKTKIPKDCQARTLHSLGNGCIFKAYGKTEINEYKTRNIITQLLDMSQKDLDKKYPGMVKATADLVAICKQNYLHFQPFLNKELLRNEKRDLWLEVIGGLATYYEVDLGKNLGLIAPLVLQVLEASRHLTSVIDFNDMLWLPLVNKLSIFPNDLLLIDEAQDLNRCQQAYALKAGKRLILCGDANQAIYGFAGADTESLPRMRKTLSETKQGCEVRPLTVTYRCGQAIVREAQQLVPNFTAHKDNNPGLVDDLYESALVGHLQNDDFVLCRTNAPLISLVFKLLKDGKKATIQGRNIAENLTNLIKKLKAKNVEDLLTKLDKYRKQAAAIINGRDNPSEAALIALDDKVDCLRAFCDGEESLVKVEANINKIFQGLLCRKCSKNFSNLTHCPKCTEEDGSPVLLVKPRGIVLSSIHRAKGLEANNVLIIKPELLPHPAAKSDWQKEQERNLKYVAITRAKFRLTYVISEED